MKAVNYEALSPILFLERSARIYKNKVAIIDRECKKTYQEFFIDCITLAKAFKKLGLSANDKVAYLCRNTIHMLEAHYAVPMLGGVLVPINTRLNPIEVNYILKHSDAKVLVIEADFMDSLYEETMEKIFIISDSENNNSEKKYSNYKELIGLSCDDETHFINHILDEEAAITLNYTSGTTGNPKGALYSHRSAYLNAMGECLEVGLNKNSVYLWVLPMFHCNGWCFTWAVTAVGATHICMNSFKAENAIDLILHHKVTHFCAAPTVLSMLLTAKNFMRLKETQGLTVITAGSSPAPQLIKNYHNVGVNIIHVYGLTETHGPHTICPPDDEVSFLDHKACSLKALQGFSSLHGMFTRVVDNNMKDVPPDSTSIGEVVMRGNNVMRGYYKDPANTEVAFKEGWFHSGDLAVVHLDGTIEIKDRIKDIIISGGEKISSIEIENVIYQLPEVLFVAVIASPDEEWGEVPHAIIELKEGWSLVEQDVKSHCRAHLAHFKCPKIITFQPIPKTTTGKIQKYLLRKCNVTTDNVYSIVQE